MTDLLAILRLVDDLRNALTETMNQNGNPAGTPGAKVDLSRLDALPHPFDGMEEAQRAAGIVPTAAASYRVCVRNCESGRLGEVMFIGNVPDSTYPPHADWLPCDKEGWVPPWVDKPIGLRVQETPFGWRPIPKPQFAFTTGHADAIPKPSALDEMAEQVRRWAVPLESTTASEIDPSAMLKPALAVPTAGTKPTNPKDAAATGRVPLGLLSPIAKAHWALAQHCGRTKYGAWNWREAGARASIYLDAIGRHADGYLSGETHDPADGTHHLGNIMACCAILLEAEAAGKLVDDRPPHLDMRPTYADVERRQADITAKYADRNPKHWTR